MLSFHTKESHIKWLFTTAVAMTGSALKLLLSDACGRNRRRGTQLTNPFRGDQECTVERASSEDLEIWAAGITTEAENRINFIKI